MKANESPVAIMSAWIVIVLISGLAVYVLSTGPAVMLRDRGVITQETFLTIYAPLMPFDNLLEPYLQLWP